MVTGTSDGGKRKKMGRERIERKKCSRVWKWEEDQEMKGAVRGVGR